MRCGDRIAAALVFCGVIIAAISLVRPIGTPLPGPHEQTTTPPSHSVDPSNPYAFLASHPNYVDRTKKGGRKRKISAIRSIVLHDREGRYTPSLAPYHIEVTQAGKIMVHYRADQIAPHAYRYNRYSIGVAYGGYSGEVPSRKALKALEYVIGGLRKYNEKWKIESHGEAFARTRGTRLQASKYGRSLVEAAWRENLHVAGYRPVTKVPVRLLLASRKKRLARRLMSIGKMPNAETRMCVEPL